MENVQAALQPGAGNGTISTLAFSYIRTPPNSTAPADAPHMETRERRFGRYEVVAELGRGAMGVVYEARDPRIDRLVALKTVSLLGQEPEQEAEFRQRFTYEAQAAGRLHHPGIVAVFDAGEEIETHEPFIVMERVVGESLSRVLSREKKLALPQALQLAEEIAEALDYAHAQGVVHRDIKPANILITKDGHAKIADFGIAKLNLAHFTLPGRLIGTPAYMAPEQLTGEAADGRADLFSLGVILYVMVTGHSPFHGNSATTVCFKVVNRDPMPASTLDLDLPRALDALISRAMAKDPGDRFQRGAEFAGALRQLRMQGSGSTANSAASRFPGTGPLAHAGVPVTPPEKQLNYTRRVVRTVIHKTSIKDLVLGAALVVLLIIVGIPSRKTVASQEAQVAKQAVEPGHPEVATPSPTASPTANPARTTVAAAKTKRAAGPVATSLATPVVTPVRPQPKQVLIPSSTLDLAIQHQFKDATLTVWVDDTLALTRPLHGGAQNHLVVFKGFKGINSETLKLPAGTHTIRFQAQSADQSINLTKTVTADFIGGNTRTLQVTFDKHQIMHLSWQ
jgi:serine/threonine protein kinase